MAKGQSYKILIGGGGTGGHVFPAIAIADALKLKFPDATFLFVGALGRLEMEKVPEAGYEIEGLPVAGFQRRLTIKNVTFFFKLASSMWKSRAIVRKFKPDVAVGVGGYASGPILKAAARKGVPILIQEQNSYAGLTNRMLSRSASAICVAYEGMDRYFPAEKIQLTGNPIRQHLADSKVERSSGLQEFGLEANKKTCMIVGGSLGARTLNRSLLAGLDKLDSKDIQVIWQCGKNAQEEIVKEVAASGLKNIKVLPFISKMDCAYAAADLIVSRAGAISISELCVIGKPVILVPSPNVAEDHQTRNAEALSKQNAAVMLADSEAEQKLLDTIFDLLNDENKQLELSENIKKLGIPDAAERIAGEVTKLMEDK